MNYTKEIRLLKEIVPKLFAQTKLQAKKISYKKRNEIVTSSDLYIETEIIKAIKVNFPNDKFHSEEFNRDTLLEDRTWTIDPIDGTSNYAHNLELYVVQIALYDKGDLALSYVYAPRFEKVYYAIKGEGSFLNDERISVLQDVNESNKLMSIVGISHQTSKDKSIFMKLIELSNKTDIKVRALGSLGLEMAAMSEGSFVILYTDVTNLWDIAPGILLIKEAGGIIVNEKGKDYSFKDDHLFAFSDKKIMNQVINFINN